MEITQTKAFNKLNSFVLGNHPRNTIFAFNFHNVRHIISFLSNVVKNHLPQNNYSLVDIGAGRSPYHFLFVDKISKYIAMDLPESLPIGDNRGIEQINGVAENIPLGDQITDVVLCNQVLEHVDDPVKAVNEIYRILKPGGIFIGSVPNISPIHLEPYDYWRFTELGIKKLFSKSGFTDIYVEGNGGVHKAAVLMITMDWLLSKKEEGKGQQFYPLRALLLSPLIGLMNGIAMLMDKIIGNKYRTPANLCWVAKKP